MKSRLTFSIVTSLVLFTAGETRADNWCWFDHDVWGEYPAYWATATTSVMYGTDHNFGISPVLHVVDGETATLVAFPGLIGNHLGQIPPGSNIMFARLSMKAFNDQTVYVDVHQIYAPWDEATMTGNIWDTRGEPRFGPSIGTLPPAPKNSGQTIAVTEVVQKWANGERNWGFILRIDTGDPNSTATSQYYSEDFESGSSPTLCVEFTPPPLLGVQQTTWGKIKALYR